MAATLVYAEAASLGLLSRGAREGLQEGHRGNGACCPASASAQAQWGSKQCQPSGRRLLSGVSCLLQEASVHPVGRRHGPRFTPSMFEGTTPVAQVWRDSGWRWCHVGRQLQTAMNTSKSASSRRLYSPARATAMADSITLEKYASGSLQAGVRSRLCWCLAEGRAAVASAAALLTGRPVSEGMPTASQCWAALLAVAATCVVGALVVARLPVGATSPFLMAMALVGDFGEVGPRPRSSSLRPAIKKQAAIEMEGQVQKALPNAMFQVALDNGCQVLAHISGKIRRNRIEIFQGDRVKVEISPYDLTRGRITHRNRRAGSGPAPPGGSPPPGGAPAPASTRNST